MELHLTKEKVIEEIKKDSESMEVVNIKAFISAIGQLLVEKGLISEKELDTKVNEFRDIILNKFADEVIKYGEQMEGK